MNALHAIVLLIALAIVIYVHAEIPRFTGRGVTRGVAHGALVATGIAVGVVWASTPGLNSGLSPGVDGPRWLALVAGFTVVHVPAAAILGIKAWRHSGQS